MGRAATAVMWEWTVSRERWWSVRAGQSAAGHGFLPGLREARRIATRPGRGLGEGNEAAVVGSRRRIDVRVWWTTQVRRSCYGRKARDFCCGGRCGDGETTPRGTALALPRPRDGSPPAKYLLYLRRYPGEPGKVQRRAVDTVQYCTACAVAAGSVREKDVDPRPCVRPPYGCK